MKRALITGLTCLLLCSPLFGQFGKLKKYLDKAQYISDLKIDDEEEHDLGAAISARIRALYGVQQDVEETRYVTRVGLVVAQQSGRKKLDYRFILLDSDSTNAFAAPGGFIHVTRGALALMNNESELAGVLAHEIAHVAERHTINGIRAMKGIELVDSETQSLKPGSPVFEQLVDVGTELVLKGFSREQELEADEEGVKTAARAKYHPNGLGNFLTALGTRYADRQKRAGLFASHPETKERLTRLAAQIAKKKLTRKATAVLAERFASLIRYEAVPFTGMTPTVAGTMGVAEGAETAENKGEQDEKSTAGKEDKKAEESSGGGVLASLSNPFGSGQRQQRAEVTGTAGARGVETELGLEKPGDATPVEIRVTKEELKSFKREGGIA